MLALNLLTENTEGPNTELLWLLWILLGLFALAIVVGWWAGSRSQKPIEVEGEAESTGEKPEDLTRIEGIGPKVAKILSRAGIATFHDLANSKPNDVQKLLDDSGLQMMDPEGWIEQAKLADHGDWNGFEKLQRELKGGRKIKKSGR